MSVGYSERVSVAGGEDRYGDCVLVWFYGKGGGGSGWIGGAGKQEMSGQMVEKLENR